MMLRNRRPIGVAASAAAVGRYLHNNPQIVEAAMDFGRRATRAFTRRIPPTPPRTPAIQRARNRIRNQNPTGRREAAPRNDAEMAETNNGVQGRTMTRAGNMRVSTRFRNNYRKKTLKKRTKKAYKRKFKKVKKYSDPIQKARHQGFLVKNDIYGFVADPDTCYIGFSTFTQHGALEVAVLGLLRTLFKKFGGYDCNDINALIHGTGNGTVGSSFGWLIGLQCTNKQGGATTWDQYALTAVDTFQTLVGNYGTGLAATMATIMDRFKAFSAGDGPGDDADNVIVPFDLQLYMGDQGTGGGTPVNYKFRGNIKLTNAIIVLGSKVELRCQNRTPNDDATLNTDNLNVHPIQAKSFELSSAVPCTKTAQSFWPVESLRAKEGVTLARGAEFPTVGSRHLPSASIWKGLKKSYVHNLSPGNIQTWNLGYKYKKNFVSFLRDLHVGEHVGAAPRDYGIYAKSGVGNSMVVAFEDIINVVGNLNIKIAYECKRLYGGYCKLRKDTPAVAGDYSTSLTNDGS